MKYYKLRIDYSPMHMDQYKIMEERYFDNFLRVHEEPYGTNPHFHYYVEMIATEVALRQFIRKIFGKGNGVYSLKAVTPRPVEYVAYMLKHTKTEQDLFNKGIDTDFINECRFHDDKVKAEMQIKKQEKRPMWVQVMEYVESHAGQYVNYIGGYQPALQYKNAVVKYVIQFYKEKKVLYREYQILAVVDTVLLHLMPEYESSLHNSIIEKLK